MDPEFWRTRWQTNAIAFHQAAPSKFLVEHIARAAADPDTTVLVPMSGKTKDLTFLANRGHRVVACEIVEQAVSGFYDENAIPFRTRREDDFTVYESDHVVTYVGDFYRHSPDRTGPIDWNIDRAALIAWHSEQHARYVSHLLSFLRSQGTMLLITVDYDQKEMSGPPFSAPAEQLYPLLEPHGALELLDQRDALEDRFRARGCTRLTEQVWLFRRSGVDV
jgi:thiopurine S-methyltransferase